MTNNSDGSNDLRTRRIRTGGRASTDIPVRILADNSNEQGDLLTRLASDVFFTLGYDNCLFDVHKTGRELDLIAPHRHEPRKAIAEFKSGVEPAGGSDINKFVGALDAQRRREQGIDVHGYFISLAGFKSTALEQENEVGNKRLVLLDGRDVSKELVEGGFVVPPAGATATAMSFADPSLNLEVADEPILIGHRLGWIWAVRYRRAGSISALCMIHANGSPLALSDAKDVIQVAKRARASFAELKVINPMQKRPDFRAIKKKYAEFLQREFGGITLEGLPADQSVGTGQFRLEALYVPLKLAKASIVEGKDPEVSTGEELVALGDDPRDLLSPTSTSVASVIMEHPQVAILGLPGSGKTTLLKRLAVAYSNPSRLKESGDELPNHRWFPIVIKCRQLAASATDPIFKIIGDQSDLAEIPERRDEFISMVTQELISGNLLLLVDGLDEIANQTDRAKFVAQLRTFIGVYPTCRLVVTSREAGFRSVAASVSSICDAYKVDGLSNDAIRSLVSMWHSEVMGKSPAIQQRAVELSQSILTTSRVRSLAVNPLMLTTLLLVQRWMGELPRRRSVLYDKAIEVLLMTWNIEGHEPLDKDEVIPQLAYVAFSMMADGKASITVDELTDLLNRARRDLPELLSYTKMSAREFVDRVEERSSLMTLSGHDLVNGQLKATYEFKHLTFQEYLAALAVVERWIIGDKRSLGIAEILSDYLELEAWREVVTLASVLSGTRASEIVSALTVIVDRNLSSRPRDDSRILDNMQSLDNLVGCLRDEAPLAPDIAKRAIMLCIKGGSSYLHSPFTDPLAEAVHGGKYDQITRLALFEDLNMRNSHIFDFGSVIACLGLKDAEAAWASQGVNDWIMQRLVDEVWEQRIYGSAVLMQAAFMEDVLRNQELSYDLDACVHIVMNRIIDSPIRRDVETFHMLWALAWALPRYVPADDSLVNALQLRLVEIWRGSRNVNITRVSAWALISSPFVGAWTVPKKERASILDFAFAQGAARGSNVGMRRNGGLVIRRYLESLRQRRALAREIADDAGNQRFHPTALHVRLLESLGPDGAAALVTLRESEKAQRPVKGADT